MSISLGKPAPAFTLPDARGGTVSLADLRGRDVILYFYPRDETPGCTKEACAFRDLWSELERAGATVLGVSPDSAESHERFAANHRLPFTLLSDPNHEVMERYGAWGEKTLYGKKSTGVIRSTVWIGADGNVRKHWKKVRDAAAHPAEVLKALADAAQEN
jgi:thioredoxin-dependent peroxiredoxin